jgi:hypothetical protein
MLMALSSYTLDETSTGSVLDPADGYVINLTLTQGPLNSWAGGDGVDPATGKWRTGLLSLKGEGDPRPFVNVDGNSTTFGTNVASAAGLHIMFNANLKYAGRLQVISVPTGSTFALDLSDVEVTK